MSNNGYSHLLTFVLSTKLFMSFWSQSLLQERHSPVMQLLSLFHDYSLGVITIILIFVRGVSYSIVTNNLISDSVIVTRVEVIWTILPVVILVALVIPSLQILYYMEENDPYLTVKVTGYQWYWEYNLSDLDINFESFMDSTDELWRGEYRLLEADQPIVMPLNKSIRVLITARDVLHCWTVPTLGVKADAVPGRLNQVYLEIMRPRVLYGQCSEICGANHRFMPINVEAISASKFLKWCRII